MRTLSIFDEDRIRELIQKKAGSQILLTKFRLKLLTQRTCEELDIEYKDEILKFTKNIFSIAYFENSYDAAFFILKQYKDYYLPLQEVKDELITLTSNENIKQEIINSFEKLENNFNEFSYLLIPFGENSIAELFNPQKLVA